MSPTVNDALEQYPQLVQMIADMKVALATYYPTASFRCDLDTMFDGSPRIDLVVELGGDVEVGNAYDVGDVFLDEWLLPRHTPEWTRIGFILDFV